MPATDLVDHPPCDDDDDPITEVDVAQDDRKSTTRARVRDLNDRITAALAAATTAPPLSVPPPLELEGGPAPASVAPASAPPVAASVAPTAAPSVAPVASIAPVRMARRYEWADLVIALIYLVAIFASATTIGMTIAHAFGHR